MRKKHQPGCPCCDEQPPGYDCPDCTDQLADTCTILFTGIQRHGPQLCASCEDDIDNVLHTLDWYTGARYPDLLCKWVGLFDFTDCSNPQYELAAGIDAQGFLYGVITELTAPGTYAGNARYRIDMSGPGPCVGVWNPVWFESNPSAAMTCGPIWPTPQNSTCQIELFAP